MLEQEEKWLPVVGFEDYYEVSDQGRVRSLPRLCRSNSLAGERRVFPRILKPAFKRRGGMLTARAGVNLSVDGIAVYRLIHQLVLESFVGPRPPGHETRHLNGNASDNRLQNLKWGTALENAADTRRHGNQVCGTRVGGVKLCEADILAIRAALAAGVPQAEIARRHGVAQSNISFINRKKSWNHVD